MIADPLVLDRVVSNLVANASRYGKPPIRVVASQRDQFIRILVSDAGDGVPEDLVPRLFDRFERGDERTEAASASRSRRRTPTPTAATCSTSRTTAAPVSS